MPIPNFTQRRFSAAYSVAKTSEVLDFSVQPQAQTAWCWAAVASSISLYFNNQSAWSQCAIATAQLSPLNCCANPGPCNKRYLLELALGRTRNLDGQKIVGAVQFDEVLAKLAAKAPICLRVEWDTGDSHFVVCKGAFLGADDSQQLIISDPIYGDNTISWGGMFGGYKEEMHGTWTHTYLTKP